MRNPFRLGECFLAVGVRCFTLLAQAWEVRKLFRKCAQLSGHSYPEEEEIQETNLEEEGDEGEEHYEGGEEEEAEDDEEVEEDEGHHDAAETRGMPSPREMHDAIRPHPDAAPSGLQSKRADLHAKLLRIKELQDELGTGWLGQCVNTISVVFSILT